MGNVIDKLAWTPVRNRAMLFARSRGQTLFYTVGGKRNLGESDEEALAREVLEETGATLITESIRHRHTFVGPAHGKPEGTLVQLACYDGEADRAPVPSSEVEELVWFTSADRARTTESGRMVLEWLLAKNLIS